MLLRSYVQRALYAPFLERTIYSPVGVQVMLTLSAAATSADVYLDPPASWMAGAVHYSIVLVQLFDVLATLPETIRSFAPAAAKCLARCTDEFNGVLRTVWMYLEGVWQGLTDAMLRLVIVLFPKPQPSRTDPAAWLLERTSGLFSGDSRRLLLRSTKRPRPQRADPKHPYATTLRT